MNNETNSTDNREQGGAAVAGGNVCPACGTSGTYRGTSGHPAIVALKCRNPECSWTESVTM